MLRTLGLATLLTIEAGCSTPTPETPEPPPVMAAEVPAPAPSPPVEFRKAQRQLCDALASGRTAYANATNDLKRSKTRGTRRKAMEEVDHQGIWLHGTVKTLTTTRTGRAVFEMALAPPCEDYSITTANNDASEALMGTESLVAQELPLFDTLASLELGQEVLVIASLEPDPEGLDAYSELSMTEQGSMMGGAFLATFQDVAARRGRVVELRRDGVLTTLAVSLGDESLVSLMNAGERTEELGGPVVWAIGGTDLVAGPATFNGDSVDLRDNKGTIVVGRAEPEGRIAIVQGETTVDLVTGDMIREYARLVPLAAK